ncbi:O-methyltransferase [Rhizosphaericola mali]|nr:class I SAM-dependent methyltransferase [Rhizosphaericola mali]
MIPQSYLQIKEATDISGFNMASNIDTCFLLRSLVCSKPNAHFLELGTGTGLATSFILDGMDANSSLISVDNDPKYLQIAQQFLSNDKRLELVEMDGGDWLLQNETKNFDFIFADTWHGKYLMLDNALNMLKIGGFYIIDDMLPQPNWPEGHDKKASKLTTILKSKNNFSIVELNWASGIIIATRKF